MVMNPMVQSQSVKNVTQKQQKFKFTQPLRIQTFSKSGIKGSNPILRISQDSPGFLGNLHFVSSQSLSSKRHEGVKHR